MDRKFLLSVAVGLLGAAATVVLFRRVERVYRDEEQFAWENHAAIMTHLAMGADETSVERYLQFLYRHDVTTLVLHYESNCVHVEVFRSPVTHTETLPVRTRELSRSVEKACGISEFGTFHLKFQPKDEGDREVPVVFINGQNSQQLNFISRAGR